MPTMLIPIQLQRFTIGTRKPVVVAIQLSVDNQSPKGCDKSYSYYDHYYTTNCPIGTETEMRS
jgi:hypothetical protein